MNFSKVKFQMKKACIIVSLFLVSTACQKNRENDQLTGFDRVQEIYLAHLDSCISHISHVVEVADSAAVVREYLSARRSFKKTEPIMAFTDVENYETLNQPNLLRVKEEDLTDIKINEPEGFQVLEELIFATPCDLELVSKKAIFVRDRLSLIRHNTNLGSYKPYHFLWLLRNAFIQVAFTGVTGYDSPVLLNSLRDAQCVFDGMEDYLRAFDSRFSDNSLMQKWEEELLLSRNMFHADFDEFDRYSYYRTRLNRQIALWNETVNDWQIKFPLTLALANHTDNLFSMGAYNISFIDHQAGPPLDSQNVKVGKKLFYDARLSGDGELSCVSCHQPQKAFTDGQVTSKGRNGKSLPRNAPTLTYAAFQNGFFHDKRTGNLEGQIISVVIEKDEFHTDLQKVVDYVSSDVDYQRSFEKLYKEGVTSTTVRNALASYVKSLAPFNSRFDSAMWKKTELTEQEVLGANLFMGKASCATCHFPPFFNGTIPPRFKETDMENLGVPADADNKNLDEDPGRFNVFKTEQRKHFFKTPTVRNAAYTAPYMHNGVYRTLEQVMEFYNVGGGEGLGYDVPLQTLPSDSLHLTENEQAAIIAFLKTLSDNLEHY